MQINAHQLEELNRDTLARRIAAFLREKMDRASALPDIRNCMLEVERHGIDYTRTETKIFVLMVLAVLLVREDFDILQWAAFLKQSDEITGRYRLQAKLAELSIVPFGGIWQF